jgi:ABC-2 type transport system permease protein
MSRFALLDVYRAQFRTTVALQLQYRAALVIWLIGMVLEPTVYLVVWGTVARSSGGSVSGYTGGDFAAYYLLLMLVNHTTFTWIMFEYEYRVRQGMLSFALLRPIHPIHSDIADNVTYKMLTLTLMLPTAAILALAFKPTFHTAPWAVLAFFPALLLAFLLRFLLEWTFAQAAFWTTRTSAINQIYYGALLFLSGEIAPLALLPGPLQKLAAILPFRWMIAFPIELCMGKVSPQGAWTGMAAQVVWIGVTVAALRFVWSRGVKRYSAVGA